MNKVDQYMRFLKSNNYSKNTIKTYFSILKMYCEIFDDIRNVKKKILSTQKSPNTTWTHYNVILSYMNWTKDKRASSLRSLKLPKIPIVYRNIISKSEVFKKTENLTNQKNVVVRFLFVTGIRCDELKNIISFDKSVMRIKGKGNKIREIFHDYNLSLLLNANVSSKTIRIWVKEVLGNKYSPHSLRRSHATHMLLKGANPKTVMMQLGHSKVETTYKYLQLNNLQNKRIYDKYF